MEHDSQVNWNGLDSFLQCINDAKEVLEMDLSVERKAHKSQYEEMKNRLEDDLLKCEVEKICLERDLHDEKAKQQSQYEEMKNLLEGKIIVCEDGKKGLENELMVEKEKSCALKFELSEKAKLAQEKIEAEKKLLGKNEELQVESRKIMDQLKSCTDELIQNNEHLEQIKFEAKASASKLKQQKKDPRREQNKKR